MADRSDPLGFTAEEEDYVFSPNTLFSKEVKDGMQLPILLVKVLYLSIIEIRPSEWQAFCWTLGLRRVWCSEDA